MATFRRSYGVSAWEIGLGRSLSWAEAVDLAEAALNDTATPLFASVADWEWPASIPDLILIGAAAGKAAELLMPWAHPDQPQVSDAEIAVAHTQLLDEIRFSN